MLNRLICSTVAGAAVAVSGASAASAAQLYFSSRQHGEIVNTQYTNSPYFVTISADNLVAGHPDLAVVFDTQATGTADPDLEDPWDMGNLVGKTLNKALIIAENSVDANGNGLIDSPDDEGASPAGTILFKYKYGQKQFGLDLIDFESGNGVNNSYLSFTNKTAGITKTIFFKDFITPASPYYDPTVVFGNNSANRIKPITSTQLGLVNFSEVRVHFATSGAIDNIIFETTLPIAIPEPASLAFMAVPAATILRRQRRSN